MEKYITTISNKETIFSDENIKIGNLILSYDKMSDIKYRNGDKPGFVLNYDDRKLFIPCGSEEKSSMMPFFQKAVKLERQRKEQEKELTLDDFAFDGLDSESETVNLKEPEPVKNIPTEIPPMSIPPISMENNSVKSKPVVQPMKPETANQPQTVPQQQAMTQDALNSNQPLNVHATIEKAESKAFWSVGRLVMGILSILLFILISFQSCAAGISNALEESNSISGSAGFILGLFMLAGGIVGVATRKSTKKGGCIASSILYAIGSAFGGLEWNSTFSDLQVWVVVSILLSLFYMFCAIMTKGDKRKRHIVGYIIYGLLIACLIGGIALGGSNSTTTNSTSTNDTTTTTTTEEQNEQVAEESKYPMTIEDNDYFTLEVLSSEYDDIWGEEVKCKFTNKTDKHVLFSADSIILNGETTLDSVDMTFNAAANTNNEDSFLIEPSDYEKFKDSAVEITVNYNVMDYDEYDTITEGKLKFTIDNN